MRSYAIVEFGAPLQVIERATPQPTGTEVLLKVRAAGVCHSDLHIQEGSYDLGGGKKLRFDKRGVNLPLTLGHETVGDVVAIGPEASGVEVGATRLIFPWIGCGTCSVCQGGEERLCTKPRFLGVFRNGGYSDHILVPHPRYLLDIGSLTPAEAAPYACAGLTTYGALKKVGPILLTQPVLIIGAGGLGLMSLTLLKAMGGRGAIVADIAPGKREAATKAGALVTIDPGVPDAVERVSAVAGGPVAAAIDFVGSSATARLGIDALAKGGKYIIVGLFGGDITLSLPLIPLRSITVQGFYLGTLSDMAELLSLVQHGEVARIPIGTRPLEQANATLEDLRAGGLIGRMVLVP